MARQTRTRASTTSCRPRLFSAWAARSRCLSARSDSPRALERLRPGLKRLNDRPREWTYGGIQCRAVPAMFLHPSWVRAPPGQTDVLGGGSRSPIGLGTRAGACDRAVRAGRQSTSTTESCSAVWRQRLPLASGFLSGSSSTMRWCGIGVRGWAGDTPGSLPRPKPCLAWGFHRSGAFRERLGLANAGSARTGSPGPRMSNSGRRARRSIAARRSFLPPDRRRR